MMPVLRMSHRPMWRLRLLATMLAVVGQLGLSSAALTLARDESSVVSHVERTGINIHHGHNEAACAACASLSFHANPNHAPTPASTEDILRVTARPRNVYRASGPNLLPNSCRAPPSEV